MIKHWVRHPSRTFYWWYRMRGKMNLTIELDESMPISTSNKKETK